MCSSIIVIMFDSFQLMSSKLGGNIPEKKYLYEIILLMQICLVSSVKIRYI